MAAPGANCEGEFSTRAASGELWTLQLGRIRAQAVSPLRSPIWHGNSVTQRVTHPPQTKPVMKHSIQSRFRLTQAPQKPIQREAPAQGSGPRHIPGWPWHGAASNRAHLSHGRRWLGLTCPNTRARHSPPLLLPKLWLGRSQETGGKPGWVQRMGAGGPSRPRSHHPAPSLPLFTHPGGTARQPVEPSPIPPYWRMGRAGRELPGCSEETRGGEGETRSQTQHHLASSRANRCARAAQEFYHLKTTPGRFLLVSLTVYQNTQAGQLCLAGNAQASPLSSGTWGAPGDQFLSIPDETQLCRS